jgi:SNF2-related domain
MGDDLPDGLTRLSYSYAGNFSSLLAFGVLTLSSFKGLPGPAPTAPDGWNWAPPLPWIVSRRTSFEGDLEFLCHNDFIRATYKMEGPGTAKVRIYVMPEDCEWYQVRETRVELRGRALLAHLKDRVDRCPKVWNGDTRTTACGHSYSELLLADDDISLNLSAIFNSLPSPKAEEEVTRQELPVVRELMESVLEDDGVPGFRSQLYQYQRESVWKMLQRELIPQKRPDPRLRKWVGPTGRMAWINTDDMTFFSKQQWVDDIPGGILCEEMGTGKTVTLFFIILMLVHFSSLDCADTASESVTASWD